METYIYSSQDIVQMINLKGEQIIGTIIANEINDFAQVASRLKKNYRRYSAEDVPISRRKIKDSDLASNEYVNNDFAGDIVDQIKGFVFGEAIKTVYPETGGQEKINNFIAETSLEAADTELAEYMLGCGYGSRLLYVEAGTGNIKVMNTKPWQTIFFINDSTEECDYAMIFYDWVLVDANTGKGKKTIRAEWYDKTNVSYYIKQGGKFVLDKGQIFESGELKEIINPQPHLFDFVPVLKVKPNPREQCSFEKVKKNIDAYDSAMSDWLNEIIEFRNAYLLATGGSIEEEERIVAKKTGVFNLPDKDAKIEWLVKNLNPDFIERFMKIAEANIYKYSKTMNMNDDKFAAGGAESGEARKWRLLSLFFEGIVIERYFSKFLREQYKVIFSAWNKGSYKLDYRMLEFNFTRKLPVDLLYYAQVSGLLKDNVSDETRLSLLPFVKDITEELKVFDAEQQKKAVNLYSNFDNNSSNT